MIDIPVLSVAKRNFSFLTLATHLSARRSGAKEVVGNNGKLSKVATSNDDDGANPTRVIGFDNSAANSVELVGQQRCYFECGRINYYRSFYATIVYGGSRGLFSR